MGVLHLKLSAYLSSWAVNFHTWLSIITISGNKQNENMPKVIKRWIIVYIQK